MARSDQAEAAVEQLVAHARAALDDAQRFALRSGSGRIRTAGDACRRIADGLAAALVPFAEMRPSLKAIPAAPPAGRRSAAPRREDLLRETDDVPILHVHAQAAWHDPAFLVGNRAALQALRDLLDTVLAGGPTAQTAGCMVADGEHFDLCVALEDAAWHSPAWVHAAVPYQSDAARECSSGAIHPAARQDVCACLRPMS